MKRLYLLTFLVIATLAVEAQSFYAVRRNRSLIFTAGLGTSSYYGELKNDGITLDAKPNINVGLKYFVSPRISVLAEANWFKLGGSDAKANDTESGRNRRNLSFTSNNYEIALTGALHLFPLGNRYYQRPILNAYAFAGLGMLYFNPTTELNGVKYALQPMQTEGIEYNRFQIVVPYGIGARVKAGPFFNFVIEGGYRMTFTDYLDDVSTVHPDKSMWTDPVRVALSDRGPEIGEAPRKIGSVRGNPATNDGYLLLNAKIEYYLPTSFGSNPTQRKLYKQRRKGYRRR